MAQTGALGVCRAHSGTLWGILLDSTRADVDDAVTDVARRLPPGIAVPRDCLTGGGPRRADAPEARS